MHDEGLLVAHAPLLMEHALEVQARPELRDVEVHRACFAGPYLPTITLRLGELVEHWRSGLLRWRVTCGRHLLLYRGSGFALSGMHEVKGVDLHTGEAVVGRLEGSRSYPGLVLELRRRAADMVGAAPAGSVGDVVAELTRA